MWQKKLARYGAFFLGRPNLPSPPPHRCGDHRDHPELWRFGQEESRAEEKACGERTASNSTKPRTVHVHFEVLFTFHLILSASCSPPTPRLRAPLSRPFLASARTPPHTRHQPHALPGAHQCPRGVLSPASSPGSTSRIVDTWSFSPLATLDCGVVPRAGPRSGPESGGLTTLGGQGPRPRTGCGLPSSPARRQRRRRRGPGTAPPLPKSHPSPSPSSPRPCAAPAASCPPRPPTAGESLRCVR